MIKEDERRIEEEMGMEEIRRCGAHEVDKTLAEIQRILGIEVNVDEL